MNSFEQSLARLGDYESNQTRLVLMELDEKLYAMTEEEDVREDKESVTGGGEDYYRGYDAISEHVDEKEIKAWRKTFPYLHVVGQCLQFVNENQMEQEQPQDLATEPSKQHVIHTGNDQLPLVVYGTKMKILESNSYEEEEVFCSHGTLEEIIEIDNSPLEETVENIFLSIDPQHSRKVEVVNNLYDALIPDLTQMITPLVQRMVHLCHERGINYTETEEKSLCSSEENDCFYSSGDDGECFAPQDEEGVRISEW